MDMNHQHAPNGSRVQMPHDQRHLQIIYFATWFAPAWFIPWWPTLGRSTPLRCRILGRVGARGGGPFRGNTPPRTPDKES